MAVGDVFELRIEFHDLIVDVALAMPCTCLDAVLRARVEGCNPRACLGCRARYVMELGRRMRGWSPFPVIGVRHIAGPHYASIEVRYDRAGRRRPLRPCGGRQVCRDCGEVLTTGSFPRADEGDALVAYAPRTTPLASMIGAGLVGRDPREPAPGVIDCLALMNAGYEPSLCLQGSPRASGGPGASVDGGSGTRRVRP